MSVDPLLGLFTKEVPENQKDDPGLLQYVAQLSSFNLPRLLQEPVLLSDEVDRVHEQNRQLAFRHYQTFIASAQCSTQVLNEFVHIEEKLDSFTAKLPDLRTSCENLTARAQEMSMARKKNSLALQKHPQLLEVLEIPQLMDTCVRNGYYEEALEIGAYVRRLDKKLSNISIIASIVDEVKELTALMLRNLVQQLRGNLNLSSCLKIVGLLRRMSVFTEIQLKLLFLQCRSHYLDQQLLVSPTVADEASRRLQRHVDITRELLFDVVTQYRALFAEEDRLLPSWVLTRVQIFLSFLQEELKEARVESVLGHCMYFGLSFGRVGIDLRGLMTPFLVDAVENTFAKHLRQAVDLFSSQMASYSVSKSSADIAFGLPPSDALTPPMELLSHPPVGHLANQILNAFNETRAALPLSLAPNIQCHLQQAMEECAQIVSDAYRAEGTDLGEEEDRHWRHLAGQLSGDLVDYLNRCIDALFPKKQLSESLGLALNRNFDISKDKVRNRMSNLVKDETQPEQEQALAEQATDVVFNLGNEDS